MIAPRDADRPDAGAPARPSRPKRSPWRDYPSIFWLIAAFLVTIVHRWVPQSTWLMIHMVVLGALSHAIFVWSRFFTAALTKVPATPGTTRAENRRIALLQVGAALVMIGFPLDVWPVVLVGALAVIAAVLWHALALEAMVTRSLAARFTVTIHYYYAAAAFLMVGAGLGAAMAAMPDVSFYPRLLLGHTMANLLGWMGLTVAGTLVTFWPTMLRTRMDDRAARLAGQSLPVFVVSLAVLVLGATLGWRWVAVAGLAGYTAALLWWARSLLRPLRTKPPREFAAASVLCAMPWFVVGLIWVAVLLLTGDGWAAIQANILDVAAVFVAGFALQLLFGALSYLIPTVLGGGPAAVRGNVARMNRAATLRLALTNGALILWMLPAPSWVRVTVSLVGLLAISSFVPILVGVIVGHVRAMRARRRAAAENTAAEPDAGEGSVPAENAAPAAATPTPTERTRAVRAAAEEHQRRGIFSGGQLVAALSVLALAVTGGVAIDPVAAGVPLATGVSGAGAAGEVRPTGEEVRVRVTAGPGMQFTPSSVTVNAGDRVVVELTNDDASLAHDLALGGQQTPRLVPGDTAELDLGVVTQSVTGWCTIAGHRQMGMTFDVIVEGGDDAAALAQAQGASSGDQDTATGTDHAAGQMGTSGVGAARVTADPDATIENVVDPRLAPLPPADGPTTHEVTIDMTEEPLEVAPGRWQTRWTFDGGPVGPTLRGRVGDTFEVTIVNNGTMGHSIDFHASWVAPDQLMRTIQPGESLTYTFVAHRAGVWMYHCGTAPVSSHIAAGMAGAVVIEPEEGLPAVDHEFSVVQSEVYLGNEASRPEDAVETDAQKIADRRPDFVTFNGIANQYQQEPFEVRVGETVRFFVMDVGPNEPTAFHVIGGQFDTTYVEGAYQLMGGRDAFGNTGGGSQALALQPSQGGFVELSFPEPGNYTVLSHIMSDAELGAIGVVHVTQ